MAIAIVQLGSPREEKGIRVGTVRRPPRGVKKEDYSKLNFFDTWLPLLSPSAELMKEGKMIETEKDWEKFAKKFKTQMKSPEATSVISLLATLSHQSDLAIGCYCEDEGHCHRSILKELLIERGAEIQNS